MPNQGREAATATTVSNVGLEKPRRAGHAVAALGALAILLLWAGIGLDLNGERQRLLHQAEAESNNLARTFEEHIQRTITGLDQSLLYLKAEYERSPEHFDVKRLIAETVIFKGVSVQVALVDAEGILQDSNITGFTRIDLSDREHFRVHRQGSVDGLFISKPVLGRASNKWSVQLTRRLNRPDGGFAGIMAISLDPYYLSDFYGSIDVGRGGSIMLLGRDGVVRAAAANGTIRLGASLPDAAWVERLFIEKTGARRVQGPLDGEKRVAAFRALPNFPLAVWVGRSEAEVLESFHDTEITYLLVGTLISLVLGASTMLVYRLVRQQEAMTAALESSKAEVLDSRERLRRYVADLERISEVAAHDLQEPLRRVVAYSQLLSRHAKDALDPDGREYLSHVVTGARRMRDLVRDLGAFVEVDHDPLHASCISATAAVKNAARRLSDDIRAANASLTFDPLPVVMAEDVSLTEIFFQLLSNSIQYSSPERILHIHVSAHVEDSFVTISVRDNASGMAQSQLIRLFEVLYRHNGNDGIHGMKIGLVIARRMVERLGGRIWAESQKGEGSCFYFTVPLAEISHGDTHLSLPQQSKAA